MRCFHHRDVEAVGLCKACYRGICGGCASEVEGGLACHGHVDQVVGMSRLITANVATTVLTPVHYLLLGMQITGAIGCVLAAGLIEQAPSIRAAVGYLFYVPAILLAGQAGAMAQWILARRVRPV
jgi:hypothetical protein